MSLLKPEAPNRADIFKKNDEKFNGSSCVRKHDGRRHERAADVGERTRPLEATAMAITGVAFAMYPVTDLPRAVTFYTDVLGLTKAGLELEYWVEFDIAGSTFGIGTFEQVGVAGTAQSLALEVGELAAFRTALSEHGVASTEPFETPVCRISETKDPDGNRIWLHERKPA